MRKTIPITVWTLATDGNNNGTEASVHLTANEANKAFYERFVENEMCGLPKEAIVAISEFADAGDYAGACDIFDTHRGCDLTWIIEEHQLDYPL